MQTQHLSANANNNFLQPVTKTPELFPWQKAKPGKAIHHIRKPMDVVHAAMSKINKLNCSLIQEGGYSVIFYDNAGKIISSFATSGKIIFDSMLIFIEVCRKKPARCSVVFFGRKNLTPTAADMMLITCLFEPLKSSTGLILDDVMVLGKSNYFSCVVNGTPLYINN